MRGMTTITFDTLKFSDSLKAAGVPDKQAEAEARALAEAFSSSSADVATKSDVREVRTEIDLLRKDMQALELRLTIKLGAFMTIAVGILISVLRH